MRRETIALAVLTALLVFAAVYVTGWFCNLKGYVAGYEDGRRDAIVLRNLRARLQADSARVYQPRVD